jgi:hypothetical protein
MAKELPKAEQGRIIDAAKRAARLHADGMQPTMAIEKVARDSGFSAPVIRFMTQAFNKSLSVARMQLEKQASRQSEFPLADAEAVIQSIFSEGIQQKVAFEPPDTSTWGKEPEMQKTAAEEELQKDALDPGELARREVEDAFSRNLDPTTALTLAERARMQKLAGMNIVLLEGAKQATVQAQEQFRADLNTAADVVKRLFPQQLQKVAQAITNQYRHSQSFLALLNERLETCELPTGLQKTAHCAVLPSRSPYKEIGDCFRSAENVVRAQERESKLIETANRLNEKQAGADKLLSSFTANTAAEIAGSLLGPRAGAAAGGALEGVISTPKREEALRLELDPTFQNKERELSAKAAFNELALFDPDLKQYSMPELIKSYNDSVSLNPESIQNQAILKQLMLGNIRGSGQKDIFQISQEQSLADQMASARQGQEALVEQAVQQAGEAGAAEEDKHQEALAQSTERREATMLDKQKVKQDKDLRGQDKSIQDKRIKDERKYREGQTADERQYREGQTADERQYREGQTEAERAHKEKSQLDAETRREQSTLSAEERKSEAEAKKMRAGFQVKQVEEMAKDVRKDLQEARAKGNISDEDYRKMLAILAGRAPDQIIKIFRAGKMRAGMP